MKKCLRPLLRFLCCSGLLCFSYSVSTFANTVIIPKPQDSKDMRYTYSEEILKSVLSHTEAEYGTTDTTYFKELTSRERSFQLLLSGRLHVMAEAVKPHWEKELLVIRVPLRKGILGVRLFFVHNDIKNDFAKINSLEELKQWPTGSGAQWSTRRIMEDNGFKVVVSERYKSLFKMLNAKRFLTFNRGANEIYTEADTFKVYMPDVSIDDSVALLIPIPTYFFVSPKYPQLANRIKKGLAIIINNGEFDKIFNKYYASLINQVRLSDRLILKVDNKNLSPETLKTLEDKRLWLEGM